MDTSVFIRKISRQISDAEKLMLEQKLTEAFDLIEKTAKSLAKSKASDKELQGGFLSAAKERIELLKRRLVKEMARKL
jgi:hypothetical protein